MSLRGEFQELASSLTAAADDVAVEFAYVEFLEEMIDPTEENPVRSEVEYPGVVGFLHGVRLIEAGASGVDLQDLRAVIPGAHMPQKTDPDTGELVPVVPDRNDRIRVLGAAGTRAPVWPPADHPLEIGAIKPGNGQVVWRFLLKVP